MQKMTLQMERIGRQRNASAVVHEHGAAPVEKKRLEKYHVIERQPTIQWQRSNYEWRPPAVPSGAGVRGAVAADHPRPEKG